MGILTSTVGQNSEFLNVVAGGTFWFQAVKFCLIKYILNF
jgi:hypothetical protein